jgi:hypothetical protein
VTQALVDELEAVQVGRQQHKARAAGARQLGQPVQRRVAVGQVGQLVVQGLTAQRLGGALGLAVGAAHGQQDQRRREDALHIGAEDVGEHGAGQGRRA